VQVSFGSRTRSVLGGLVLGDDDLGDAGVRLAGAWMCNRNSRRCLEVVIEALAGFAISLSLLFSWDGNQL